MNKYCNIVGINIYIVIFIQVGTDAMAEILSHHSYTKDCIFILVQNSKFLTKNMISKYRVQRIHITAANTKTNKQAKIILANLSTCHTIPISHSFLHQIHHHCSHQTL